MGGTSYSLGQTLLKIENVCLEYDGRPVLSNVSADVRDIIVPGRVQGQVVGVLGPSGCGKTSLFRIIAGLTAPTSGRVSVNGFDRPVRAGEVGVVSQSYPLFDHRTVLGNLMLAAKQKEKDSQAAHDKVMGLLREFELEDKFSLYPAQLSGGQRFKRMSNERSGVFTCTVPRVSSHCCVTALSTASRSASRYFRSRASASFFVAA